MWIYISNDFEVSAHADSNIFADLQHTHHLPYSSPEFSPLVSQLLSVCSSDITKLIWFKSHLPLGPNFLFRWRGQGLRRAGPITIQLQPKEDLQIWDRGDGKRARKWHHPTPIRAATGLLFSWLCLVWHIPSICTDLTALTEGNHVRVMRWQATCSVGWYNGFVLLWVSV